MMCHVLAGSPVGLMKVRVDDAVPLTGTVTPVGLRVHDGQAGAGHRGGGVSDSWAVPENPFRLVTTIVEFAVDPDWTV